MHVEAGRGLSGHTAVRERDTGQGSMGQGREHLRNQIRLAQHNVNGQLK